MLSEWVVTVFDEDVEQEGLVKVVEEQGPDEPHSVFSVQRLHLPVHVSDRVLVEPGKVLEGPPFLSVVPWLPCGGHELSKIAISVPCKRPKLIKGGGRT